MILSLLFVISWFEGFCRNQYFDWPSFSDIIDNNQAVFANCAWITYYNLTTILFILYLHKTHESITDISHTIISFDFMYNFVQPPHFSFQINQQKKTKIILYVQIKVYILIIQTTAMFGFSFFFFSIPLNETNNLIWKTRKTITLCMIVITKRSNSKI